MFGLLIFLEKTKKQKSKFFGSCLEMFVLLVFPRKDQKNKKKVFGPCLEMFGFLVFPRKNKKQQNNFFWFMYGNFVFSTLLQSFQALGGVFEGGYHIYIYIAVAFRLGQSHSCLILIFPPRIWWPL